MKKVIIPIPSETSINLIELNKSFVGLIVCKIHDDIKGVIIWYSNDDIWVYVEYLNLSNNYTDSNELIDLIQNLTKKYPNMEFFVTEK